MDGETNVKAPRHRSRAWRLGTVGLIVLALIAGGWATSSFAASARSRSHQLVSLKGRVEHNCRHARVFTRNVFDRSAEGGNITAWFYKSRLQKLALHLFGETGQAKNTYWLSGKWLFCVAKERWKYNRRITSGHLGSRPLKMAKVKHEEFYLAKGQALHRATPKARLVKLSASRRKAAERQLTREYDEAARIFKTHGKSSKHSTPYKAIKAKHGGSGRAGNSVASAAWRRK